MKLMRSIYHVVVLACIQYISCFPDNTLHHNKNVVLHLQQNRHLDSLEYAIHKEYFDIHIEEPVLGFVYKLSIPDRMSLVWKLNFYERCVGVTWLCIPGKV